MSTILVTGAAGFIAYKVCQDLLLSGSDVVGIDNMNDAYDIRLKKWHLSQLLPYKKFTLYRHDIRNRTALQDIATNHPKIDAVINLAARAGVRASLANPWEYMETNLTGTLNLLEMCRVNSIPKFILASSSSVYGKDAPLPTPEDADTSHPLQPYAASKKAGEVLSYSYHHLYGLDVTVFRYFNVYGPGCRADLAMYRFMKWISEGQTVKLNGDGSLTRGFTYIDDISTGTLAGLKPMGFEIINLGGHEQISMMQLIRKFEKLLGKKAKIENLPTHPADMPANWADVTKARKILDWDPQISLDKGLGLLVDWYKREQSWASQLDTE
jgi:nucleoside-diphosphate-sugar epimerase